MSPAKPAPSRPLLLALTPWLVNGALLFWLAEAMTLLVAMLLKGKGARLETLSPALLVRWQTVYVGGQVVAGILLLGALMARNAWRAAPMAPFRYTWLAGVLTVVLLGSTVYLVVVAAPAVARYLGIKPLFFSVSDTPGGKTLQADDDAFRNASGEMSTVFICQALASTGLILLHVLCAWEESQEGKRRRWRRLPPWRVPA